MALSSTGFNARRFTDIRTEMFDSIVNNLAIELNTSSETVLGVLANIVASSITDIEELAQAVSDNFNIDKAEGKFLDDLVALIALRRLGESYSTGVLHFKSTANSSTIPAGSKFSDSQGNLYSTVIPISVSNLECTECEITPNVDSGTFSVTINGTLHSVTYAGVTAYTAIVDGLRNAIIASAPTDYTVQVDGSTLTVIKNDKSTSFSVIPSSSMNIGSIEVGGNISADEVGAINPEIGAINVISSTVTGLTSVYNYFTMTVGRLVETDEELRSRHSRSTQISGNATAPALYSKLANITGVSQVRIFQNISFKQDNNGLPPKSFECIVEGGNEQDIADAIYNSMPLGVETYGTTTTIVQDYAGNNESVNWSRPTIVYLNVKVTYSLYNEESFPDDGVESIKKAIIDYGDSLPLDHDIIPQRFMGYIYNNVEGIGAMTIEVGTSVNPSATTPDTIPYQTTPISIDARSKPDFDAIRIQVVEA